MTHQKITLSAQIDSTWFDQFLIRPDSTTFDSTWYDLVRPWFDQFCLRHFLVEPILIRPDSTLFDQNTLVRPKNDGDKIGRTKVEPRSNQVESSQIRSNQNLIFKNLLVHVLKFFLVRPYSTCIRLWYDLIRPSVKTKRYFWNFWTYHVVSGRIKIDSTKK